MGFSTSTSIADNNFVAVPFNAVGYNTADIQQIQISDGGAGGIGWGTENFSIWEGIPTVRANSEFVYCDPSLDPDAQATDYYWGDLSGASATYSIAPGQAVAINTGDAGLTFRLSGDVPMGAVSFSSIADNNFTGNPFPQAIDIQAITISDGGNGGIGWGTENFSIWEGIPTVRANSEFVYCDPSLDPDAQATDYYWGDLSGASATYSIAPGQGVVINTGEADLTITINPPYTL